MTDPPLALTDAWHRAPVALLRLDLDGVVLEVNRTLLRWLDQPEQDVVGHRLSRHLTVGGRIYWETHLGPLLRMQGGVDEVAVELRGPAGRMPVLLSARVHADVVEVALSGAAERSRYERELLAARSAAELSAGRLGLLQEVTAALSRAAGVEAAARALLGPTVQGLGAGGAALWLADTPGAPVLHRTAGTVPARPSRRTPRDEVVVRADGSVVVPLTAPNRSAGALVLSPPAAEPESGWPPDPDLLLAIGRQAAVALERAAMQDRSASVAHELQHVLLSTDVPDDDRYAVTTVYRPGVQALEVGGDWYDVFLVRDDVLAVTVGDVVGRGLQAAAAMGQLRSAVRAVADDAGPGDLLVQLDRFVARTGVGFMATLAFAEVDLASGDVAYACAGHLPPLHLSDAAAFLWHGRSTPLGVPERGGRRPEGHARLGAGDRLLLYTDGLVERRDRPLDESLADLATAAGALGAAPVNRLVADTLAQPGRELDDVCLLALTWFGGGRPGHALEARPR
ncbi:SpoIIE family protein phosphatase [Actinotalea solisilvae]|uniref:SpoIIE family protein phosphatase n=1 Tax=Actinotalea solisilvae TaxID=2072922 RepID=UPI0018F1A962|nr:SpoIIE family protein phosphatase [Actinotalea solisilvae]